MFFRYYDMELGSGNEKARLTKILRMVTTYFLMSSHSHWPATLPKSHFRIPQALNSNCLWLPTTSATSTSSKSLPLSGYSNSLKLEGKQHH